MLGIFRVHGLALIRRFLLAKQDLLTVLAIPALSALSDQFAARMQR
jgi:hypothetical protein